MDASRFMEDSGDSEYDVEPVLMKRLRVFGEGSNFSTCNFNSYTGCLKNAALKL
jgi:hypothetical protein